MMSTPAIAPYAELRRAVTLLALVAGAALAFLLLSASAARADGGYPPSIGGGNGVNTGHDGSHDNDPGGGSTGGGNNGGGGSGGSVDPCSTSGCWTYGSRSWDPNAHTTSGSYSDFSVSCPQKGDGRWAIGFHYGLKGIYAGMQSQIVDHWAECDYAPPPEILRLTCSWSAGVVINGPYNNGYGVSPQTPFYSTTKTSPFQGSRSVSACQSPLTVYTSKNLSDLGQYSLSASARAVACTYTNYSGSQTDVWDCGSPYNLPQVSARAQVWCDGWSQNWTNDHDFSFNECQAQTNGRWQCVTAGTTVNGAIATQPQVQKGQINQIIYPTLQASGDVKNVRSRQTPTYLVMEGSTPNKENVSDDKQLWTLTPNGSQKISTYFYAPGETNAPFVLRRTQHFTADFLVTTIIVDSMDPETGAVSAHATETWRTGEAYCTTTQAMNVYRPRISN